MKTASLLWAAIAVSQLLIQPLTARAGDDDDKTVTPVKKTELEKAPPLPLHTIEGVGGLVITPVAYLVNPGPAGTVAALPSFSTSYVNAGEKNIEVLAYTETFYSRFELGFAASRFGLGTLGSDIQSATGIAINRNDVYLYDFNARFLALKENSFDLPLPAITVGVSGKVNDGINELNNAVGGALSSIGYASDAGADFTVTATKGFPIFGHPLLITAGGRATEAAQLGYAGFGDTYHFVFEGNIAYSLTNWLWLAAEFRQKPDTYGTLTANGDTLVRREQNWWTVGAAFILSPHATATLGYGHFGNVLNTVEDGGVAVQFKYEL
jgi:hypothetical protein